MGCVGLRPDRVYDLRDLAADHEADRDRRPFAALSEYLQSLSGPRGRQLRDWFEAQVECIGQQPLAGPDEHAMPIGNEFDGSFCGRSGRSGFIFMD